MHHTADTAAVRSFPIDLSDEDSHVMMNVSRFDDTKRQPDPECLLSYRINPSLIQCVSPWPFMDASLVVSHTIEHPALPFKL